jgi:hypothetical protein
MWTACTVVACAAGAVRADDITLDRAYRDVTIRGFDGEFVLFDPDALDTVAKRLDAVMLIRVDSVPGLEAFNRAERLLAKDDFDGAAAAYQQAVPRARGFWKPLIEVRYLTACDRAGNIKAAADAFISLSQKLPDKADHFRPVHLDRATPDDLHEALGQVERVAGGVSNQDAMWQLQLFKLDLLQQLGRDKEVRRVAVEMLARLQTVPPSPARWRLQLLSLRIQARHGDCAETLRLLEEMIPDVPRNVFDEILLLKGRCLLALAEDRAGLLESGLTLMRVVIHYKDGAYVSESLFLAAQVHERIERPRQAIALYRRCAERADAGRWGTESETAIQRLQTRKVSKE